MIVTEDEKTGLRTLLFERNGARQSVVRPSDPDHLELPYLKVALAGLALTPAPGRILVVGLGGGSLPTFLRSRFPEAAIDVVEIDPLVARVARDYFGFREDGRLRVHLADGRRFIEQSPAGTYDAVFLDAFGTDRIPAHLTTLEFLLAAKRAMTRNAVLVGNVWGPAWNPLYGPMLSTYQAAFSGVVVLGVRGDANRIFICTMSDARTGRERLAQLGAELAQQKRFGFDLRQIVLDAWMEAGTDAPARVLRDPVAR